MASRTSEYWSSVNAGHKFKGEMPYRRACRPIQFDTDEAVTTEHTTTPQDNLPRIKLIENDEKSMRL